VLCLLGVTLGVILIAVVIVSFLEAVCSERLVIGFVWWLALWRAVWSADL